jgi:hypothetical protein
VKRPTKAQAELAFWLLVIVAGLTWGIIQDGVLYTVGWVLAVVVLLLLLEVGAKVARKIGR